MKIIIVKPILQENEIILSSADFGKLNAANFTNPLYSDRLKFAAMKDESVCILADESAGDTYEVLQSSAAIVENIRKTEDSYVQVSFWDNSALLRLDMTIDHAEAYLALLSQSLHNMKQVLISLKNGFILNVRPYDGKVNNWHQDVKEFSFTPSTLRAVITEAELSQIFTFLANEACTLNPTNIDHCITFQYAWNGCFARAHKMREVMDSQFNVSCQKIFNYGSLAVFAYKNCVTWGWHVAPVVTVVSGTGINEQYVIDPSIATMPLTVDQWRNTQLNSCYSRTSLTSYDIVDGRCYGRNNAGGNYTSFDDTYYYTNKWLDEYRNVPTFE